MKDCERNKKIIFGISIALLSISGIFIIISLLQIIYVFIGLNIISDESALKDIVEKVGLGYETYLEGTNLIIGHSTVSINDLLHLGLGLILTLSIIEFLCSAFELFTGIFCLKYREDINKYKYIFCFSVIAAVTSLLTVNFLNMILCIIIAVFSHATENIDLDNKIETEKKH